MSILNPIIVFILGLGAGVLSKWMDIHTLYLGEIFSELPVWILIGVIISICSRTRIRAVVNVFLFFVGMLISYYITAEVTHSVYGWRFIHFWFGVACVVPFLAYFVWMTKEKGFFPKVIAIGITAVCAAVCVIIQGLEIHDFVILALLVYFLFVKKIRR